MRPLAVFSLAVYLAGTVVMAAPAPAPVPVRARPRTVARSGPITPADLYRVSRLYWCGNEYEISFARNGQYLCVKRHDTGAMETWSGPWELHGSTVILEETHGWLYPDRAPEWQDGPITVTLDLRVREGVVIGTGWHSDLRHSDLRMEE